MVATLFIALLARTEDSFNYTGPLTGHMNESATWGTPTNGLPVHLTISDKGAKVSIVDNSLKGDGWKGEAKLDLDGLSYVNGELKGTVAFKNSSGVVLEGLRFDVLGATEAYTAKDATGKEIAMSRAQTISEESPILLGDLQPDQNAGSFPFHASGLKWNPETTGITVTLKLAGIAFLQSIPTEDYNAQLAFDLKGRLLLGSGQREGIYRYDPKSGKQDLLFSVPGTATAMAVHPIDGTIVARWTNSHEYKVYSPSGDDRGTIAENGEAGMDSWPSYPRYDSKGNLYLAFGSNISLFNGGKPTTIINKIAGFDLHDPFTFDVTRDGTIVVASEANIFSITADGKNGKKLVQGPDVKLGRTHGVSVLRTDASGNIWIADTTDNDFSGRCQVFDRNGKFLMVFGRSAVQRKEDINDVWPGQIPMVTHDFAFAPNGHVFVSGSTESTALYEFAPF